MSSSKDNQRQAGRRSRSTGGSKASASARKSGKQGPKPAGAAKKDQRAGATHASATREDREEAAEPAPSRAGKEPRLPSHRLALHAEFVSMMSGLVRARNRQSQLSRAASMAMRQSEKKLRQVLETASEAVLEVDSTGRILLLNRAAEKMFGYSRQEMLELNVDQLVPAELRKTHAQHRARYMQHPYIRPMGMGLELKAQKKDRTLFPVEIGLSPRRAEDGLKTIIMVHDVSERKRMQEALRSSEEKLYRAEKLEALARMAGGTAHEFNNLLTMMMGYATLMLSSLDSRETLVEYIGKINKASSRAAEVTRQLLAFSQRQVLAMQVLDLNALLAEMNEILVSLMGSRIAVDIVPASGPALVRADRAQMHQVLINLALNARDAMPEGGSLSLHISQATLRTEALQEHPGLAAGEYVKLTVADTGEGMRHDIQTHLFEPFFSTKQIGKGTGLGLAMIHGIVQQSGGSISVESTPGKGSTFTIFLPQASTAEMPAMAESPEADASLPGGETILLVEDEEALRSLTRQFLEGLGYTVLAAAAGEEAINAARKFEGTIDLLLTDVRIPEMTGLEIASRIKSIVPGIKVLYVSGYVQDAFAEEDALRPGEAFLEKPYTFEELSGKIRAVLAARPLSNGAAQ